MDHIQRLGEHRWVIPVIVVARDLPVVDSRSPNIRSDFAQRHGRSGTDRKLCPKSPNRDTLVLLRTPSLARMGIQSCGCVRKLDESLHLVAVLSARPRCPSPPELARFEKLVVTK